MISINWRRGLLRLWIAASVVWLVAALVAYLFNWERLYILGPVIFFGFLWWLVTRPWNRPRDHGNYDPPKDDATR